MIAVALLALAQAAQSQESRSFVPPATERVLDLSIEEAVRHAIENNPSLAGAILTVQSTAAGVDAAIGAFQPVAFFNPSAFTSTTPTANSLAGAEELQSDTLSVNTGIRQTLPTGGSYTLTYNMANTRTNNAFALLNPQTFSSFEISFTQPLLRGAWTGYGRIPQLQAEVLRDQAVATRQLALMDTIQQTYNAYWDLVFTLADRAVKRQTLARAERLLEINRKKVEEGLLAEVEIYQAQTDVATSREALLTAENALRAAEDALKQLLFPFEERIEWSYRIRPLSAPPAVRSYLVPRWEEAVSEAFQNRPDLARLRWVVKQRELDLEARRSEVLPLVNFVTAGRSQALALRADQNLGDLATFAFPFYSIGLQVQVPLGNLTARSREREAEVNVSIARQAVRAQELTVTREVRDAIRQLLFGEERVSAARRSREYAEKQLQAEQLRFEQGLSTNFEVISLQRDLAQALTNEQLAILNYAKAGIALERSKGTLAPPPR